MVCEADCCCLLQSHYTNTTLSMLPTQKLDNIKVRNLGKSLLVATLWWCVSTSALDCVLLYAELLGDGQLEQLELLESSDTISLRSYDVRTLSLWIRSIPLSMCFLVFL